MAFYFNSQKLFSDNLCTIVMFENTRTPVQILLIDGIRSYTVYKLELVHLNLWNKENIPIQAAINFYRCSIEEALEFDQRCEIVACVFERFDAGYKCQIPIKLDE